jgi:hypothetical protein
VENAKEIETGAEAAARKPPRKPPLLSSPDFEVFDYVSGLAEDDHFSNIILTIKKENTETKNFEFCTDFENPKITLNQVGRMFGGGRYQVILRAKEDGKNVTKKWNVPIHEFWNRVKAGEIDENGNPTRPGGSAPEDSGADLGTIIKETVAETVRGIFNTLKDAGVIGDKKESGNRLEELLSKMLDTAEKRNLELLKMISSGKDDRAEALIEGWRKGVEMQSAARTTIQARESEPEERDDVMELIKLVKSYLPSILDALGNKEQKQNILNMDSVKEAITPANLPGTWSALVKEIGQEAAADLLKKLGVDTTGLK